MERNKNFESKVMDVKSLVPFELRGIRQSVIDKLKERIGSASYNPAHPLTVVYQNGNYIVADGNHRLKVLNEIGVEQVNCIVYDGVSPYRLAVEGNNDEDTYAPMDLFDWLELIQYMKDEGKTQKEIAEEIGWSESKVKDYGSLLKKIVAPVLNIAANLQNGRATGKVAFATFNFTEGWFRTSGIYSLNERNQIRFLASYIKSKFKTGKKALQDYAIKLKKQEEQHKLLDESVLKEETKKEVRKKIDGSYYLEMKDFEKHLNQLIEANKKYILKGDAVEVLKTFDDNTIDLVITDPPYGIDYVTNFRYGENDVAKEVNNDTPEKAFELLEKTCEVLKNKVTENAHLYFFTSFKVEPVFRQIIAKHFKIKNVLIWVKNNWSMGDLEGNYAEQYEMIIFATNGKKPLNEVDGTKRHTNVFNFNRVANGSLLHSCQKPVDLLEFLIKKSSNKNNMICDPFMGSGSTLVAAEKLNRTYIGIDTEEKYVEYAKQRVEKVSNK